jgi:hypothetical protein
MIQEIHLDVDFNGIISFNYPEIFDLFDGNISYNRNILWDKVARRCRRASGKYERYWDVKKEILNNPNAWTWDLETISGAIRLYDETPL